MIPASVIRMDEFAAIAELKISTMYIYHSNKLFDFPNPEFTIARTHFWRRSTARRWARKHKRLAARGNG